MHSQLMSQRAEQAQALAASGPRHQASFLSPSIEASDGSGQATPAASALLADSRAALTSRLLMSYNAQARCVQCAACMQCILHAAWTRFLPQMVIMPSGHSRLSMEVWDIITVIIKVVSTASMLQDHVCQMYEHGSQESRAALMSPPMTSHNAQARRVHYKRVAHV